MLEQEYSRHRKIAKGMLEDLKVGFEKEKGVWKRNYEGDLEFYREEYELFKGFVEDILRYLKRNNLDGGFGREQPGVVERIRGRL